MTMPVVPRIDRPPRMPSLAVERSPGDSLAAGNRDFDLGVGGLDADPLRNLADVRADHRARGRD